MRSSRLLLHSSQPLRASVRVHYLPSQYGRDDISGDLAFSAKLSGDCGFVHAKDLRELSLRKPCRLQPCSPVLHEDFVDGLFRLGKVG